MPDTVRPVGTMDPLSHDQDQDHDHPVTIRVEHHRQVLILGTL